MIGNRFFFLSRMAAVAATVGFLAGCAGTQSAYHSEAYAPAKTSDVQVKVSLSTQNVYVLEDGHLLMATPTCVGKPGFATPTGQFKVTLKNQFKRSETYGYYVRGSEAHPAKAGEPPPGGGWTYVGYPLAFWVEFAPGYGFHEGPIWPYPRSHGCLHLHETASAKFFKLVQVGTPVEIRQSLPEDALYGRNVRRPTDYADPDPAPSVMIDPNFFTKPREDQLIYPTATPAPTPVATTAAQ